MIDSEHQIMHVINNLAWVENSETYLDISYIRLNSYDLKGIELNINGGLFNLIGQWT